MPARWPAPRSSVAGCKCSLPSVERSRSPQGSAPSSASADQRRNAIDAVGPDPAGVAAGEPPEGGGVVNAAREAAIPSARGEHLRSGSLHARNEAVGPAPEPGRDIDGNEQQAVATGGGQVAAPAQT